MNFKPWTLTPAWNDAEMRNDNKRKGMAKLIYIIKTMGYVAIRILTQRQPVNRMAKIADVKRRKSLHAGDMEERN